MNVASVQTQAHRPLHSVIPSRHRNAVSQVNILRFSVFFFLSLSLMRACGMYWSLTLIITSFLFHTKGFIEVEHWDMTLRHTLAKMGYIKKFYIFKTNSSPFIFGCVFRWLDMYSETPESASIKPRINPLVISKVYLVQYIGKLFDSEHSWKKMPKTRSQIKCFNLHIIM